MFFEIKEIDPDIIHIQDISAAIPGLLSKIFLKKPYVIWGQGSDVYFPARFTKFISKTVLHNSSTVIALNENMKREMNRICKKDDIIILPNGIELENFKDIYPREQQNIIKKTIIFVGGLKPIKGIDYLIKAMKIITEKSPDTNLLIVGDGTERKKLETLVRELNLQNSISFAGKVTNEQIPKYMAQADVFVLPSLSEGFGIVVVEAMASGLPIVTTNVRGLPELVKNGENGFIAKPKDPKDLAEKIMLILENKDLRETIAKTNIIKAREYTWDHIVDELITVYNSILQKSQISF
jgi:glycosyltransferase involved in cell wall biosynthesis